MAKVASNLRIYRENLMMSKAELARKAGLNVLTIGRIEDGEGCRVGTRRKILEAFGLKICQKSQVDVFGQEYLDEIKKNTEERYAQQKNSSTIPRSRSQS